MESATSRMIRVGSASIGLVGLDTALNKITGQDMSEEEAVDYLFAVVSGKNYIPSGMEGEYRKALLNEYRKHMGADGIGTDHLIIRVFGSGCISCNKLQELVIQALDKMGLAADIEQIHDPDEIGRHGILRTPALKINDEVKISGLMPSPAQIENWIREWNNTL